MKLKLLVLFVLSFAAAYALAQSGPRAWLITSYPVGTSSQVCEYSDGSRFTISIRSRCAAVLY